LFLVFLKGRQMFWVFLKGRWSQVEDGMFLRSF